MERLQTILLYEGGRGKRRKRKGEEKGEGERKGWNLK